MQQPFDPVNDIENADAIFDGGKWPNFHDAIVHSLNFWRGDMRPDEDIWIAPVIEASFELDALEHPYVVDIRFHDCDQVRLTNFDHNNDIHMLSFAYQPRGFYADGTTPLSPYVRVVLERGRGQEPLLSFACFRVEAVGRRPVPPPPCR